MSLETLRKQYAVPAWRGVRVRYTGEATPRLGVIIGSRDSYLRIRFDGQKTSGNFHPTWMIEYLENEPVPVRPKWANRLKMKKPGVKSKAACKTSIKTTSTRRPTQ